MSESRDTTRRAHLREAAAKLARLAREPDTYQVVAAGLFGGRIPIGILRDPTGIGEAAAAEALAQLPFLVRLICGLEGENPVSEADVADIDTLLAGECGDEAREIRCLRADQAADAATALRRIAIARASAAIARLADLGLYWLLRRFGGTVELVRLAVTRIDTETDPQGSGLRRKGEWTVPMRARRIARERLCLLAALDAWNRTGLDKGIPEAAALRGGCFAEMFGLIETAHADLLAELAYSAAVQKRLIEPLDGSANTRAEQLARAVQIARGGEAASAGLLAWARLVDEPAEPDDGAVLGEDDSAGAETAGEMTSGETDAAADNAADDADGEADADIGDAESAVDPDPRETIVVIANYRAPRDGGRWAGKKETDPVEELAGRPIPLVATPDLAAVRRTLVVRHPHLVEVIDTILTAAAPHRSVRLPPVLLVGSPGCGKTTLARDLGAALGLPTVAWDAGGSSDTMILGISRKWGSGEMGLPLQTIVDHKVANPLIVFDELEKAGGSQRNGDVRSMLLGLLEPRSAANYVDQFLEVPVDYSALNWIFTANDVEPVPLPLRNRLRVLRCPDPGPEHLALLAPQLLASEYAMRGFGEQWIEPLSGEELDSLAEHWPGGSIRDLKRYIAGLIDVRDRLAGRA